MVSILSLMTVLMEPQALYSKLVILMKKVSKHQKKLRLKGSKWKGLKWRKRPDRQRKLQD